MAWIILLVVVLLAGLIYLSVHSASRKQTDGQFQQSLAKFLEGKLKALPDQPDGFQIEFQFKGYSFVYEDVPDRGFAQEARKAYLKINMGTNFTLYFTEKPRSTTIRTDLIIASQIPDELIQEDARVRVPAPLKGLNVHTNDPSLANRLFASEKMLDILLQFRNADSRGYPSMALRMMEGALILEYHSAEGKIPNYRAMRGDLHSLEDHFEDLITLARFLKGSAS